MKKKEKVEIREENIFRKIKNMMERIEWVENIIEGLDIRKLRESRDKKGRWDWGNRGNWRKNIDEIIGFIGEEKKIIDK